MNVEGIVFGLNRKGDLGIGLCSNERPALIDIRFILDRENAAAFAEWAKDETQTVIQFDSGLEIKRLSPGKLQWTIKVSSGNETAEFDVGLILRTPADALSEIVKVFVP